MTVRTTLFCLLLVTMSGACDSQYGWAPEPEVVFITVSRNVVRPGVEIYFDVSAGNRDYVVDFGDGTSLGGNGIRRFAHTYKSEGG
jgi:hypothetical protein